MLVSRECINPHPFSRYEINAVSINQRASEEDSDEDGETVHTTVHASSTNVADLKIGVASFCKAFPWHFVTDKRLELVQLGKFTVIRIRHHLRSLCQTRWFERAGYSRLTKNELACEITKFN